MAVTIIAVCLLGATNALSIVMMFLLGKRKK